MLIISLSEPQSGILQITHYGLLLLVYSYELLHSTTTNTTTTTTTITRTPYKVGGTNNIGKMSEKTSSEGARHKKQQLGVAPRSSLPFPCMRIIPLLTRVFFLLLRLLLFSMQQLISFFLVYHICGMCLTPRSTLSGCMYSSQRV